MPELCFKHFTERPCIEFSSITELKRVDIDVAEETVSTEQAGEDLGNFSKNANSENGSPILHINVVDSSPDKSPCRSKDIAETYCFCRKPDDGSKMIFCENENCKIKWFHVKCLKIKENS